MFLTFTNETTIEVSHIQMDIPNNTIHVWYPKGGTDHFKLDYVDNISSELPDPKVSVPDLIGRENMDYTISANDYVNKDKEIG